ncbi:MAG: ATP synthase F1 subunit delta [Pseudomonadota bacterium]|nr:ATP synthase F1 subunit delta [Pseudomonadota bacterium]
MYFALASNYAESLYESDCNCQNALNVLAVASQDSSCKQLLYHPDSSKETILAFLCSLTQITDALGNFLHVLVEKKRLGLLPEIAEAYRQTNFSKKNIIPVTVKSAKSLKATDKKKVLNILEHVLDKNSIAQIHYSIDKSLLASLQIQYHHNVIDLSLKGQLDELKNQILGVEYE